MDTNNEAEGDAVPGLRTVNEGSLPPRWRRRPSSRRWRTTTHGYTADEATQARACIDEAERTGSATELVLKLKIKPASSPGPLRRAGPTSPPSCRPRRARRPVMFVARTAN